MCHMAARVINNCEKNFDNLERKVLIKKIVKGLMRRLDFNPEKTLLKQPKKSKILLFL